MLYLDTAATTPVDPRVAEVVYRALLGGPSNAGSAHRLGREAKDCVHRARDAIGSLVGARRHEVVFTSGATEANNLALLGLAQWGEREGKRHIVSTQIEHKAVLQPLEVLQRRGFRVTLVAPKEDGAVDAAAVLDAVRPETLLVSVMHVNNETGIEQPIATIADGLPDTVPFFHTDAAQGYGKLLPALRHPRIDLLSVSAHKLFGPQGVGALIARRRGRRCVPLGPILFGGGQEHGLRSGTLPVALIAGFGKAAELALAEAAERDAACRERRRVLLEVLADLGPVLHGGQNVTVSHIVNLSIPGWDGEQVMDELDDLVAVSDGAACTSVCATASHVLAAMGVRGDLLDGGIRLSWSHTTDLTQLRTTAHEMVRRLRRPPEDAAAAAQAPSEGVAGR